MNETKPWVVGAAFAVTVAVIYVACAVGVLLFPDGTLAFYNTWIHGIDLSLIKRDPANPLTLNDWGTGFATAIVSGFLAGATYGWARALFARVAKASHPRARKSTSQERNSYGH